MGSGERRKCKCCRKLFRPDPRNRRHQYYCSVPSCRSASKAASQARRQMRQPITTACNSAGSIPAITSARFWHWPRIYPADDVARAISDGLAFQAFSAEYITNILETRARALPEPGPLQLTRRHDLLECATQR
jgi:hypothetical protein